MSISSSVEIAKKILYARTTAKMTQCDLADAVGCVRENISKYESGSITPSIHMLKRIADATGCPVCELLPDSWQSSTLNGYQQAAARTISRDLTLSEIETHALHGMVAEIGELHGLYQKVYQGHQADDVHLKKELGDLLWFIAEYCTACDWSLAEVAQMNIDKLKRRYPDGFDAEHSLHRQEGDI